MTDPSPPPHTDNDEELLTDDFADGLILNIKDGRDKKPDPQTKRDINFTVDNESCYGVLALELTAGKSVLVDASAFLAKDSSVTLMTRLQGGLLQNLKNEVGYDVLFLNQFSADDKPGHLILAPALPGDIHHHYLTPGKGIFLQSAHFLACKPTVQIDPTFADMTRFLNASGNALLRLSGEGDLWFSSYGGLLDLSLTREGGWWLNPDYIVAFEETLRYHIRYEEGFSADSLKGNYLGGKGRLCQLWGEGKIWLQSRQDNSFLNYMTAFMPGLINLKAL
ncbi:MAG: TIGR00266 family protein [Cyanobacteriota bacterium]